jgi:hypothetical protein
MYQREFNAPLWQAIIKTHKVDMVSYVNAVKDLAAKKAYQNIKQGSFEMLAQYSVRFRDSYKVCKATGTDEQPVKVTEQEQALDFFHGLDQGRYVHFKDKFVEWVGNKGI